jgi:hypothetical protein
MDNILAGSIMTDDDNILRNNPVPSPLASHNYSMIDEGLEEEEKANENIGNLDDEDEEFKNAQEEKLKE